MKIAIICDERKKELTFNFCKIHEKMLKYHKLCLCLNLKQTLKTKTNLKKFETLYPEKIAKEQILSRILYNEIDLLLFFKDPRKTDDFINSKILNLCDEKLVPYATNFKTAEILIKNLC